MKAIRKMDEMEQKITLKSQRIALIVAKLCLTAWCVYIIASLGVQKLVLSWPFLILLTTVCVQMGYSTVMQRKMNKDNKDEK